MVRFGPCHHLGGLPSASVVTAVVAVVWLGEIGGVMASFKDHKPRRPHRKPGGTPIPSKIPREDKIARAQRLTREKRRKVHEANRAEKLRRANPDAFEYGMVTHRKDPWSGLPVRKGESLNQTEARKRIRSRIEELQVKRKQQYAKVEHWRSVMHYATKPFAGQRGSHVVFVANEDQAKHYAQQHGSYDPWSNLTRKMQRRKQHGYKELGRHLRNLRKIDHALNKLRLKFLLLVCLLTTPSSSLSSSPPPPPPPSSSSSSSSPSSSSSSSSDDDEEEEDDG
eukprot:CAMPEP_0170200396 /NCGR_PEP_ID=MMETSP0040_2-20121228/69842_1 /TAXON_ID=641309 /ORGANISM="Lotharella oceanica, Strain CCMP622" /LENGTH=280 /DNA_ID=CAMNT_0010450577 /DNA_START=60 /DNA_END=902 /DNA_ORIENTATION=+